MLSKNKDILIVFCISQLFHSCLALTDPLDAKRSDVPASDAKSGPHKPERGKANAANGPSAGTRDSDPASWPGHMDFLGSSGTVKDIEPAPSKLQSHTFLNEYILPGKPLLLSGDGRHFPATERWIRDAELISRPQSFTTWINAKDESQQLYEITFRHFLQKYVKKNWHIEAEMPAFMWDDVYLPTCILCIPVIKQLSQNLLWYSGRDFFKTITRGDTDSVKCVVSGTVDVILIDPNQFSPKMPEDLTSIDVTRVDLTRFPGLGEVDFIKGSVSPGDCIYVPARWFQQVNTYGRTISVDVTFRRPDHTVSENDCRQSSSNHTLHHYTFQDQLMDTSSDQIVILHHYISYLSDKSVLPFDMFLEVLKKDVVLTNMTEWTDEFLGISQELFATLDVNADGKYSVNDLEDFTPLIVEKLSGLLMDRVKDFRDIIDDQQEDKQASPQKSLDSPTMDFIDQYVSELESVLVQSVEQFVKTGKMPDIKSKMANMGAKQKIGLGTGGSSTTDSRSEQDKGTDSEHYTSREDAKAKLKAKREKEEAEKAKSAEAENIEEDGMYDFLDDTEEEILADEEAEEQEVMKPGKPVRKDDNGKMNGRPETVDSQSQFVKVGGEKDKAAENTGKKEMTGRTEASGKDKTTADRQKPGGRKEEAPGTEKAKGKDKTTTDKLTPSKQKEGPSGTEKAKGKDKTTTDKQSPSKQKEGSSASEKAKSKDKTTTDKQTPPKQKEGSSGTEKTKGKDKTATDKKTPSKQKEGPSGTENVKGKDKTATDKQTPSKHEGRKGQSGVQQTKGKDKTATDKQKPSKKQKEEL